MTKTVNPMSGINDNIQRVRERMEQACSRSGRRLDEVLLVAVSKTVPVERIREALDAGLNHFGENYIQEAREKIETLRGGAWHFIGHLQRNKSRTAVKLFSMVETVDRLSLAEELNRQAREAGKVLEVLIQVNEAGEESKSGLPPEQVPALLEAGHSLPNLRIRGLMAIPPYDPEPESSRSWFRSLYQWREKWQKQFPSLDLSQLSMGMSHDLETAIEEGATLIRVGTALFGSRG
jgi:PLP dependent protein